MTSSRTPSPVAHHLYVLDGLRAVAVTAVLLRHYGTSHFFGGILGVDLFFVLSGFLITRLLTQEFAGSGTIRFDLFYLRRVCRLLPAMVALLVFVTLLRALMPVTFGATFSWWFSCLVVLFSSANFVPDQLGVLRHTWSLSAEEQFYFLWPLTLLIVLRRCRTTAGRIAVAVTLALAGAVLRMWLNHHPDISINIYGSLFTRMDSILIGAAVALADGLPGFSEACTGACRYRLAEITMAIFAASILVIHEKDMWFLFDTGFTLMAIVFAVLIATCVYEPRRTVLKRFLEWHPVVWLGRRSYGIYLYHLPIVCLLLPLHLNFVSAWAQAAYLGLGFALTVIAAALSYHYIEMPFLRLKVHLKWNFPRPPTTFPAAKAAI
jgi:peptidoglycan/LPS O-acetylase OafA/YrhL